jgi:hypothetical protein
MTLVDIITHDGCVSSRTREENGIVDSKAAEKAHFHITFLLCCPLFCAVEEIPFSTYDVRNPQLSNCVSFAPIYSLFDLD